MEHKEKQRKPKASDQPVETWRKRLFNKLMGFRKFWRIMASQSHHEIDIGVLKSMIPPEYKDRPRNQGMQYKFRRKIKGRTITVFTSYGKYGKKVGYFGWVTLSGRGIITKRGILFSCAVYDLDSFFETILAWVDAFMDLAEHWPKVSEQGPEYNLRHVPGILGMTEFVHEVRNGAQTTTTTFLLYDCKTLSKKTVRFLKRKLKSKYEKQMKGVKPKRTPRIIKASQKFDEALAAAQKK